MKKTPKMPVRTFLPGALQLLSLRYRRFENAIIIEL